MKHILFYDLETTDKDPEKAKIVQFSFLKVSMFNGLPQPGAGKMAESMTELVNPGMTIPIESIQIHRITDEMVKGKPSFGSFAPEILKWINQADAIGGYNSRQYDDVVLEYEMGRAGIPLDLRDKPCMDVMVMLNKFYPRTLVGVVKLLLGIDMEGEAHDAEADTKYTALLSTELIRKIGSSKFMDLSQLNNLLFPGEMDRGGKLVYNEDGRAVFTFGKYDSRKTKATLEDVVRTDHQYLNWMLGQEFPSDFKLLIRNALRGDYPQQEA